MTKKQLAFKNEYLIDKNATQAAIRAGYSKNTAYSIGQRLLKNVEIKKAIDEALEEIAEKAKIKAEDVLKELAMIAFSDITDIVTVEDGRVHIKNTFELEEKITKTISEIKQTDVSLSVKTHSKIKALELLGKHLELFTEKHELTGDMDFKLNIEYI